jgi:hypothetical protein
MPPPACVLNKAASTPCYNASLSGDDPFGLMASGERWTVPLLAAGRFTF